MFGVSDPAEIRVLEVLESELVSHWRDSEEAAWGAVIAVIAMARFALIGDVSQDNIGRRKVAIRQVAQTVLMDQGSWSSYSPNEEPYLPGKQRLGGPWKLTDRLLPLGAGQAGHWALAFLGIRAFGSLCIDIEL